MTDEKFTELVNLYFDNEIASVDLAWLQEELASNTTRKREFEERHLLHQAMRMALNPCGFETHPHAQPEQQDLSLPCWKIASGIASGMAACLAFGLALLAPILLNPTAGLTDQSLALQAVESEVPLAFGKTAVARYSAVRNVAQRNRCSLTAQLRLLGLQPAMTPQDQQLHGVDIAALQRGNLARSREAELINRFNQTSTMPEPQFFEIADRPTKFEQNHNAHWPSGFGTSLASFK
jgi:hypothetical protein